MSDQRTPVQTMKRSAESISDFEIWRKIQRNGSFRIQKAKLVTESADHVEQLAEPSYDQRPQPQLDQDQHDLAEPTSAMDSGDAAQHYFSESEDDEPADPPEQNPIELREELQNWGIEHQIKHSAMNALLKILKVFVPNNALPKDSRTLFKTPAKIDVSSDPELEGKYWHYGLQKGLLDLLAKAETIPEQISININIDGLPISKSSTTNFWPILVNVHEMKQAPFAAGIFCGASKYEFY